MDIRTIGPWTLLGVGLLTLLGAVWMSLRRREPKGLLPMWVFGFAVAGVGVYGPLFLEPYGRFIGPIKEMYASPSPEKVERFLGDVGKGKLPPAYQEIGLVYALELPVENKEQLLKNAIDKATDPAGKRALEAARKTYAGRMSAAVTLSSKLLEPSSNGPETLKTFDPATRSLAARDLLLFPEAMLRQAGFKPESLRTLGSARAMLVARKID